MVRQKVRSPIRYNTRKSSQRLLLISILVVILLLAVVAYVFTNVGNFAGEAIRQRIDETKQLALSGEAAKIDDAVKEGKQTVSVQCPLTLLPQEQHWRIPAGWSISPWKAVEAQCLGNRVFCYYADGPGVIPRADQLVIYQGFSGISDCVSSEVSPACDCNIKQ